MALELQMVVWTTVILFALIVFQGGLVPIQQGLGWGLGSRDEQKQKSIMQGRIARTVANHIESMLMFIPLVLVAHLADISTSLTILGAQLYIVGRVLFAPLYLLGVPVLRSAAWAASIIGTGLIGFTVLSAML